MNVYSIAFCLFIFSYFLLHGTNENNKSNQCNPFNNPTIERFCKRSMQCAPVHKQINDYRKKVYSDTTLNNHILHFQKVKHGAGYGHVIQEQAQILLLGMLEQRPVFFLSENSNKIFDGNGSLFLGNRIPEAYRTYNFQVPCANNYDSDFPHMCINVQLLDRMKSFDILNDGLSNTFLNNCKEWYRWKHIVSKIFRFNNKTFSFMSPSIVAMYIHDFVSYRIRDYIKLYRTTEYNGPSCILNYLLSRPSMYIVKKVSELISIDKNSILIGLHIRRGDSAIYRECESCAADTEPDNHNLDRISMEEIKNGLICLNETKYKLLQHGIRSEIFVMSDTKEAEHLTKTIFPTSLSFKGKAHHTKSSNMNEHNYHKLAQEIYTYMISDVKMTIGSSTLSGNAGAASMSEHVMGNYFKHGCSFVTKKFKRSIMQV